MENPEDHKSNAWEAMLYRLRKEFDPLYVMKDGVYRLIVALVFTGASLILTAFVIGLVAVATHRLGL